MSRGESDFYYSKNIICCKCYNNKPVLLLATNVGGISWISKVMRRRKGSATITPVSCPKIIKLYNNGMGGVDIIDQKTASYIFSQKSKCRLYMKSHRCQSCK